VPSIIVMATSLASARDGRGSRIMLFNMCVAVITGNPRRLAVAMIRFCNEGTFSGLTSHQDSDTLTYVPLPEPTQEDIEALTHPQLIRPRLDFQQLEPEALRTPLCAKVAGCSLHAARVVDARDRHALERLCRYELRAPFAQDRLTLQDDACVLDPLRRP